MSFTNDSQDIHDLISHNSRSTDNISLDPCVELMVQMTFNCRLYLSPRIHDQHLRLLDPVKGMLPL